MTTLTRRGLLAMALKDIGCKAKSYTGGQVKVLTDEDSPEAREQIEQLLVAAKVSLEAPERAQ